MVENDTVKCPRCESKLEKVQSCCSVVWFCKKCNQVIDRSQAKCGEVCQNPKKPTRLPK